MGIHDDGLRDEIREEKDPVARALLFIAKEVGRELKYLGNGDAATNCGGLEGLGMHLGEKLDSLSEALNNIAEAIRERSEPPNH